MSCTGCIRVVSKFNSTANATRAKDSARTGVASERRSNVRRRRVQAVHVDVLYRTTSLSWTSVLPIERDGHSQFESRLRRHPQSTGPVRQRVQTSHVNTLVKRRNADSSFPGSCRGKVHGSLARAGKVKSQTPKVEPQEKKKKVSFWSRTRFVSHFRSDSFLPLQVCGRAKKRISECL